MISIRALCWHFLTFITVSQTGCGWEGLLEVILTSRLLKQGHPEPVALVQMAFQYLQGGRLCNPSGSPVPLFGHPQATKVLPKVNRSLLCLFVPMASCLELGTTEKSLSSSSLYPLFIFFNPLFRY